MVDALRPVVPVAVVTLLVGIAMLTVDALNYRSGWNVLWMLAIPFGVAKLFDRGFDRGGGVWPYRLQAHQAIRRGGNGTGWWTPV